MASNVSVEVTAKITDLTAKMAVAKAEMRDFSAATRQAAADVKGAGGFAAATPEMRAALEQAAAAEAAGAAQMRAMRGEMVAVGGAAEGMGLHMHSASRYARELFDEISSGRTKYLPGTLAAFLNQGLGLSGAFLGATAGVAALAGGIGYLIYRAVEADRALSQLEGTVLLLGRTPDLAALSAEVTTLTDHLGLSQKEAQAVAEAMQGIPRAAASMRSALEPYAALMSDVSGGKIEPAKAAEEIAKAAAGGAASVEAFGRAWDLFTPKQLAALDAAKRTNDVLAAQQVLLAGLQSRFAPDRPHAQAAAEQPGWFGMMGLGFGAAAGAPVPPEALAPVPPRKTGAAPDEGALARFDLENRYNQGLLREAQLKSDIAALDKLIAASGGDERKRLVAEREQANAELQALAKKAEKPDTEDKSLDADLAAEARVRALEIAGEKQHLDAVTQLRIAAVEAQARAGKLGADEAKAQLQSLAADERDIELKAAAQDYAISAGSALDKQTLLNREAAAWDAYAARVATDQQRVAQEAQRQADKIIQANDKMLAKITGPFDSMLKGILQGTQTWGQTMSRFFDDMAISFLESMAKMAIGEALALALHKANSESMKFTDAETAAANTYASVSAIPMVGWVLAPAAAAAAFAATLAFDQGTMSVPSDMLAQVHQGEIIVPPSMSDMIRSGQATLGAGGGGGGIGVGITVNAMDGRSVMQALNNPTTLRSLWVALQRYAAFNPSTQGAY